MMHRFVIHLQLLHSSIRSR